MRVCVCMYVCIYVCVRVCVSVCVCACVCVFDKVGPFDFDVESASMSRESPFFICMNSTPQNEVV